MTVRMNIYESWCMFTRSDRAKIVAVRSAFRCSAVRSPLVSRPARGYRLREILERVTTGEVRIFNTAGEMIAAESCPGVSGSAKRRADLFGRGPGNAARASRVDDSRPRMSYILT